MATYGHLTLAQFEQRQGNPYFEEHGRWYRITETYVIQALDRVNYQAEECDPREAQAWVAEKTVPEPEPAPAQPERYVSDAYETPAAPTPRPPRLAEWAREHGWAGRGPIPKAVKRAYEDEFGVKTYSY